MFSIFQGVFSIFQGVFAIFFEVCFQFLWGVFSIFQNMFSIFQGVFFFQMYFSVRWSLFCEARPNPTLDYMYSWADVSICAHESVTVNNSKVKVFCAPFLITNPLLKYCSLWSSKTKNFLIVVTKLTWFCLNQTRHLSVIKACGELFRCRDGIQKAWKQGRNERKRHKMTDPTPVVTSSLGGLFLTLYI